MNQSKTDFAPADRKCQKIITQDSQNVLLHHDLRITLDAMPLIVFVLNSCRQIVYANKEAQTLLGIDDTTQFYGIRPGEALGCIHSSETTGGCGTTISCRECGAVETILKGLSGLENIQECMIRTKKGSMFNLKIKASPIQLEEKDYVIISATDIRDEKWREVMERIFFHDVMNLAGAIQGIAEVIDGLLPEELKEIKELTKIMVQGTQNVIDELHKQKEIITAEKHEMSVELMPLRSKKIVEEIVEIYRHHDLAKNKNISINNTSEDKLFLCDSRLLARILGNMVKNALEASELNTNVSIGCKKEENAIRFYVHNDSYIPESIQSQIFMRSFSTKGRGRGVGTYSIKLFTEQYLKGRAWFTSAPCDGTTFYAEFPIWSMPADSNHEL